MFDSRKLTGRIAADEVSAGDVADRQEIEDATVRLLNAKAEADRALARLVANGGEADSASVQTPTEPATLRPPAARPGYDLSSARAIAAQLALDGASRDQAGRELRSVLAPVDSGHVEVVLDEAFGLAGAPDAAVPCRVRAAD